MEEDVWIEECGPKHPSTVKVYMVKDSYFAVAEVSCLEIERCKILKYESPIEKAKVACREYITQRLTTNGS